MLFLIVFFMLFMISVVVNGHGSSNGEEDVLEKAEVEATREGSDKEQEVVFVQDLGFTVKMVSPGSEPFDIQVIFNPNLLIDIC